MLFVVISCKFFNYFTEAVLLTRLCCSLSLSANRRNTSQAGCSFDKVNRFVACFPKLRINPPKANKGCSSLASTVELSAGNARQPCRPWPAYTHFTNQVRRVKE